MRINRIVQAVLLAAIFLLLIGTVRGAQASQMAAFKMGVWQQANVSGFGDPNNLSVSALEIYRNQLYAGTINFPNGGGVYRYVSDTTWEPIKLPGTISTNRNPAITDMIVFNDQLYVGSAWSTLAQGDWKYQVWRYNGTDWENVLDGISYPVHGFNAFEVYNGELYVGLSTYYTAAASGARIWHSATGNLGTWSEAVSNGNGNLKAFGITSLKTFGSNLYAAVADQVHGVQVWKFDGTTWTTVVNNGFGANGVMEPNNWDSGGFTEFHGKLYLGVRNSNPATQVSTGGKIFATADGVNWSPVVLDGFGNVNNVKVEGIAVYNDQMYALTSNPTQGMQVWISTNGTNWSLNRANGFGNPANHNSLWTSAQVVYNNALYVGTSNYNAVQGGEVYRLEGSSMFLPAVFH